MSRGRRSGKRWTERCPIARRRFGREPLDAGSCCNRPAARRCSACGAGRADAFVLEEDALVVAQPERPLETAGADQRRRSPDLVDLADLVGYVDVALRRGLLGDKAHGKERGPGRRARQADRCQGAAAARRLGKVRRRCCTSAAGSSLGLSGTSSVCVPPSGWSGPGAVRLSVVAIIPPLLGHAEAAALRGRGGRGPRGCQKGALGAPEPSRRGGDHPAHRAGDSPRGSKPSAYPLAGRRHSYCARGIRPRRTEGAMKVHGPLGRPEVPASSGSPAMQLNSRAEQGRRRGGGGGAGPPCRRRRRPPDRAARDVDVQGRSRGALDMAEAIDGPSNTLLAASPRSSGSSFWPARLRAHRLSRPLRQRQRAVRYRPARRWPSTQDPPVRRGRRRQGLPRVRRPRGRRRARHRRARRGGRRPHDLRRPAVPELYRALAARGRGSSWCRRPSRRPPDATSWEVLLRARRSRTAASS